MKNANSFRTELQIRTQALKLKFKEKDLGIYDGN